MKRLLFFLLFSSPLLAQEKYDLLIKGATVLDPKNNLHEIRDVAIRNQMTIRNGLIVWDLNGLARDDWRKESGFHPDPRWEGQLPAKR